ncbi:hypothetical protein ABZ114_20705 [Streptomyces albidoflavus]|nr:hypothetical protein [Streptomyces sp. KE1]
MAEHLFRLAGWIGHGVVAAFDYLSLRTGVGTLSGAAKNGVPRKRR